MFGVAEASKHGDQHGGSGLSHVLDITDLVNRMKSAQNWREGDLHVTFVPKRKSKSGSGLKVGRISLYYS